MQIQNTVTILKANDHLLTEKNEDKQTCLGGETRCKVKATILKGK